MAGRSELPPARAAALRGLAACLLHGQAAQAALDQALAQGRCDPRDAGLATELFYGALRLKGRVEAVLARFLDRPDKIPPRLSLALLLAGYEILCLDRVPGYASVNWAVEYAKSEGQGRLAGLANAVLRRVAEASKAAQDPAWFEQGDGEAARLGRFFSCPRWIVELWLRAYGPRRAGAYLAAQAAPPALGLFVPPGAGDGDRMRELVAAPGLLAREGRALAFASGAEPEQARAAGILRQSFAAHQALAALAPESWPEPVWDACCGRGNKTRMLAALGKRVFASDVHHGRLKALRRELPGVPAFRARADAPPPLAHGPGSILLDLPCSGLGVLARRPDIKWKRKPEDLAGLVRLQEAILDNAWSALSPGGLMAVTTCTLNPDENEGLVERFLARTAEAVLEKSFATPPGSGLGEFFFAVSLRRHA